jgi:hypothetical protein
VLKASKKPDHEKGNMHNCSRRLFFFGLLLLSSSTAAKSILPLKNGFYRQKMNCTGFKSIAPKIFGIAPPKNQLYRQKMSCTEKK